jgi:hypothetical protein
VNSSGWRKPDAPKSSPRLLTSSMSGKTLSLGRLEGKGRDSAMGLFVLKIFMTAALDAVLYPQVNNDHSQQSLDIRLHQRLIQVFRIYPSLPTRACRPRTLPPRPSHSHCPIDSTSHPRTRPTCPSYSLTSHYSPTAPHCPSHLVLYNRGLTRGRVSRSGSTTDPDRYKHD